MVSPNGRSFHSMQAIHVVVSTSLQTVNSRWVSSPGTVPAWPEIFWMRSVAWLMRALRFLELHQEALEFRCVSVGIKHRRSEHIHQCLGVLAFVLDDTAIALMNGDADLVDLFAVDHHGLDALCDHRFRDVFPADARNLYLFAPAETHLLRHFGGNLDERLRDELHVHRIVFRPVVIMLGEAISRADNGVAVLRRAVFVIRRLEAFYHRIVGPLRMEWIVDRALGRFVVFGERSIGKGRERPKDSPYALRIHNERAHVIFGLGIDLEVHHIVANPFLLVFVPPDLFSGWIPGIASHIARRAIVEDPAIRRPGPPPSGSTTKPQ